MNEQDDFYRRVIFRVNIDDETSKKRFEDIGTKVEESGKSTYEIEENPETTLPELQITRYRIAGLDRIEKTLLFST